jgi:hypothetical protein
MPRQALAIVPERIKMAAAIAMTGESERTLQALAARGKIPGASKPSKCWTFDVVELRNWVERGKPCQSDQLTEAMSARQRTRSSAEKSGKRASRSPAGSSEESYQQAMARLRGKERASRANAR